jgi:MFS family permease
MDFILTKIAHRFKQNKLLGAVYASNILLSFHYYLIVYITSSFLTTFFSASQISVLYIIGSALTLFILLNISKILEKIGNYKLIAYLIIAETIAIFGMAFAVTPAMIALYFIIYLIALPTISFGFDILLESTTADEGKTGEIRTTYLTLGNITLILSTLLVAWILTDGDYYKVYLISLLFIIPLYFVIKKNFRYYKDGEALHIKIKETIQFYLKDKDLLNVFSVHSILQIFYAYMVIYLPIYLSKYIGFSWSEIGLMFTIMLLPFVFLELPVGWLADKKWGEKEMMTVGLALMGIFTLIIAFISVQNFILWTAVLFMTRVGASMVEATSDSYFFKKVNKNDTDTIAFYRLGGPGSYIIAPIVATLSFQFLAYSHIFIILGALIIFGCHYSLALNDTL